MTSPTIGRLAVPGASLHFELRGSGPVLMFVPSGNGDAAPFGPVADLMADGWTVLTYDRRGFSRSPLDGPPDDSRRVLDDVADAVALLDHVSEGPAHVLGNSSGAVVAVALLERHPQRLRTLIPHEPPLASVLPDADRWLGFYAELDRTYRAEGLDAARAMFRETMGMGGQTRPRREVQLPEPLLSQMLARLRRNQMFWFEHEILPYPAYLPDRATLRAHADRLVLAGGEDAKHEFPYRPNLVLSEWTGVPITHFPGGHVGYVTHPAEFAAVLRDLLARRDRRAAAVA